MTKKEKQFIKIVWDYYHTHGRHDLPWRKTSDPYHIHVSEVMLQQTQVDRVIPKYVAFLKKYPTLHALAQASLGDVLVQWQGLGYNRRAKMLHQCAQQVVSDFHGKVPTTYEQLVQLPGIGPYTAGAVMAFAYNAPIPIIETNIRTVYLHHFFSKKTAVTDGEIIHCVQRTVDTDDPRQWYWALMDYGTHLKKKYTGTNTQSKHYAKQAPFAGSNRQIRGALIRVFTHSPSPMGMKAVYRMLPDFEHKRIDAQLTKLVSEGMVVQTKQKYHIPL